VGEADLGRGVLGEEGLRRRVKQNWRERFEDLELRLRLVGSDLDAAVPGAAPVRAWPQSTADAYSISQTRTSIQS
jgi:hypothetical protein